MKKSSHTDYPTEETLAEFKLATLRQLRAARSIHTLITSKKFEGLFDSLREDEKLMVIIYIRNLNFKSLNKLVQTKLDSRPLEEKSIAEIRRVAAKAGVPYYCTLNRQDLIQAIKEMNYDTQKG